MGSWIALNLFPYFKKQIKGFIGISSAPEFLEELMWKKFNKKIKKTIMDKKIYHLEQDEFTYPITKQLIIDGRKNKVLNNKINLKIPIVLFHGTNDKVVPLNFSRKILKICKKSKKKLIVVKNGDHSLSKKNDLKKIYNELNHMTKDYLL
jgi:alpha-beta hydrolase superfamily lysophospholipase